MYDISLQKINLLSTILLMQISAKAGVGGDTSEDVMGGLQAALVDFLLQGKLLSVLLLS